MFRTRDSEEIHRSEYKAPLGLAFERYDHLFVTIAPHAFFIPELEGSEIRRTGAKEYAGLSVLDGYLGSDDIRCPLDPVPPSGPNEVRRVIGPVRPAVPIPRVLVEYLVVKHDQR